MAPKKKHPPKGSRGAKKKGAPKKGRPRKKKRGGLGRYSVEIFLGVAIGALTLGILYLVLGGEGNLERPPTPQAPRQVAEPVLHYEESHPPQPVEREVVASPPPSQREVTPVPSRPVYRPRSPIAHGPMVAVIIDDMGADMEAARKLVDIEQPITFAVLPYLRYSQGVANLAHANGKTVMLHLPMEPTSSVANPGHGALMVDMDDERLKDAFTRALEEVPHAEGVNNHMGSLFTENGAQTKVVVDAVRDAGLFFVDSRTTPRTTAARLAKKAGLPVASRDVFLDNEQEVEKIVANMRALADKARRNGAAIGIGHPYRETVAALQKVIPELADEGIVFVPAGALVGGEE